MSQTNNPSTPEAIKGVSRAARLRRKLFPDYYRRLSGFVVHENRGKLTYRQLEELKRLASQGEVPYDLPWKLELLARLWKEETRWGCNKIEHERALALLRQFGAPPPGKRTSIISLNHGIGIMQV